VLIAKPGKAQRIVWSKGEELNLGPWFEENEGLSKKAIERKYHQDTGIRRSYPCLQSKLYKMDLGYLTHKRRVSPEKDDATFTTDFGDIARFNISQGRLAGAQIKAASEIYLDATEAVQSEDSFRPPPEGVGRTADSSITQRAFNNGDLLTSTSAAQDRQLSHRQTETSWDGEIMRDLPQNFGGPVSREVSGKLSNGFRFIISFSSVDHLRRWKNKNLADPFTRQETCTTSISLNILRHQYLMVTRQRHCCRAVVSS
jgi:hypothetical protein